MVNKVCSFCGEEIEPGTGMTFIRKDGNILNFCSRKCRINMLKLKRVPRKVKWTREYQNLKRLRKNSEAQKQKVEQEETQ
ncbi:50S ribosomal protein L24e [Cuniculiplasma sp. SKW3]|uniref:50S ribosomal protein L24e n=1 Tax=unclassified Cuniculiplasma TaxID=2619706 RepID=UPI003FCF3476